MRTNMSRHFLILRSTGARIQKTSKPFLQSACIYLAHPFSLLFFGLGPPRAQYCKLLSDGTSEADLPSSCLKRAATKGFGRHKLGDMEGCKMV